MSITVMLCYESEPTGVTKLNAKWLVMKPFGFFVVSHLGLFFISGSAYISVAGLCLHLVSRPWYRRRSACRCERRILRKKHLEKCEIYSLMILPLWDKSLLCGRVENRLHSYGDRPLPKCKNTTCCHCYAVFGLPSFHRHSLNWRGACLTAVCRTACSR